MLFNQQSFDLSRIQSLLVRLFFCFYFITIIGMSVSKDNSSLSHEPEVVLDSADGMPEAVKATTLTALSGVDTATDNSSVYNEDQLLAYLSSDNKKLIHKLLVFDTLASTQDYLYEYYKANQSLIPLNQAVVCIAREQLRGKGRRGRVWLSNRDSNINCSLLWRMDSHQHPLSTLPLCVGVMLLEALSYFKIPHLSIKWPNDIYYKDKKLAGILSHAYGSDLLVGLGVNLFNHQNMSVLLDKPITSLDAITDTPIDINCLQANLISIFLRDIAHFKTNGFCYFMNKFREKNYLKNKYIHLQTETTLIRGYVRDVDEQGGLILQQSVDASIESHTTGEIVKLT